MGFNTSVSSVPSVYTTKSYCDFKRVGAGGTLRLRRIAEDGQTSEWNLCVAGSDSVLADPSDIDTLMKIEYLASRPNLLTSDPDAKAVRASIVDAAHVALLTAVLDFRAGKPAPGLVGDTGLEFRSIAAKVSTATAKSVMDIVRQASASSRPTNGASTFVRTRGRNLG